jgi:glycerophosphoryl diester phosphodiesterase
MSGSVSGSTIIRIAHRGGGSLAPENSVEGIERSMSYNVDMIEVDVRRSRDGVLMLSHDPVAHGMTATIATSISDDLRAAGIATLDDAIKTARGRTRLNLDIKEPDIADQVVETVRTHDAVDSCIVSCLDGACLAHIARVEPRLVRFFSYPNDYGGASRKPWLTPVVDAVVAGMRQTLPLRLRGMLRPLPGTGATIYYKLVTPRLVDLAHSLGVHLYTWTVDDLPTMRRLIAMGIDGITSNRPDLLEELMADVPTAATPTP